MSIDMKVLEEIIGKNKLDEVIIAFGGASLYIPKKRATKYEDIKKDFDNNISLSFIAKKYNLKYKYIKNLHSNYKKGHFFD